MEMTRTTVSEFFEPRPAQWGFRGDEILWYRMKDHFGETPLPDGIDDLVDMIDAAFREEVGTSILALEEGLVSHLRAGGMSSGMVSGDVWRDRAMPVLIQRFMRKRELSDIHDEDDKMIKFRRGT